MKLTPAQDAAITYDADEILVSAAAGSGKTAVLTERILRHLSNKVGLDQLLIVTFTEAAAAEMKERITEKIHGLINSGENALHLVNQSALLATAEISTIHAFCRKLIKEHFQDLDIDPSFRVADEAELSIIKSRVMDQIFDDAYNQDENDWFLDLVDVYGGKAKDDGLDTLVRRLYGFLESDPFPKAAAKRYATMFLENDNTPLDATPWAKLAKAELESGLSGIIEGLCLAINICKLPDGPQKYIDKMEENLEQISSFKKKIADSSFDEIYQAIIQIDWGRLPAIKEKDNINAALKERVQRIRDREAKTRLKDLIKGVFFADPKKMRSDLQALIPRVNAMMTLVTKYADAYAAEKRKRNLIDFSDLEHFAIQVLYPQGPTNMTPGLVATNLYAKYHEVLIDEYQDSNNIQDLILSAVAKRRFMVGDVKQSIYRFRRANPGLFLEKYDNFAPVEYKSATDMQSYTNGSKSSIRIDLSKNFRSRNGVVDAVNFFFSQLMSTELGEINYDSAAALHFGADYYPDLPKDAYPGMWVELLDQSKNNSEDEDEDEESVSAIIAETRMIASCIHELITTKRQVWDKNTKSHRDCKLGDIVLLSRSANSIADDVIEELKNCGIDAIADVSAAFYEQQEIKTVLAFLRVIDNPRQDIDLITALCSPTYNFTPDELLTIKQSPVKEKLDFYDHMIAISLTESAIASKVRYFLSDLETWRNAAVYLPISRLIGLIYDITKYPSHAAALPGGDIRQANLRLLHDRAIEFEETSFKGLFHFVRYIEGIYSSDGAAHVFGASVPSHDMDNRVRLMSIHKSKGLEFPIVIAGFLGKQFNMDDERKPIIMHSEKGLGPKYVNLQKRTRSKTLAHYALSCLNRRENLSEELRCLYVAMTRAKELLLLTGRTTNWEGDMEKWMDAAATPNLTAHYRQSANRYLDWVMPCLIRHQDGSILHDDEYDESFIKIYDHPASFDIRVHHGSFQYEVSKTLGSHDTQILYDQPDYPPPITTLSSKLSISEIKRLYTSDVTPDSTPHQDSHPIFDPPAFLKSKAGNNITAMAIGSALHTVAEHLDFHHHTTKETIDDLINQLIHKNLLTSETAAVINKNKILALATSKMADRIRASRQVYKETPFVMAIPANELYKELPQSKESILVHGIIDLYFEEPDGLVLVDFKSDNPGDDPSAWAKTHSTQLQIYKKAIEEANTTNVKEVLLYSFASGDSISLDNDE